MTRNLQGISRRAFAAVVCASLAGCATTSRHPWVENGERIGTMWRSETAYGAECRYVNFDGQTQRVERRDHSNTLLPGASVVRFTYDPTGELAEETCCDMSDTPTACDDGYVFKKYSYPAPDTGGRVISYVFLDKDRNPVCTVNGYAYAKLVHEGSGPQLKEVSLEDIRNQPASGVWDGVNGVAHVRYTVLDGIGAVRCGVYVGPSGEVVGRKTIEGTCSYYSQQTTTTTHYQGGRSSSVTTYK